MNTNIILDGFTAIINQLIATAVAEAVKPLEERITVLETGEWTKTQHIVVKEIQPMQDRIVALEINQTLVSSAKVDFNEAIRDVLDGYNFISRNDVVDLVDKVVENAIDAYDFSDSIDWDNKVEEGINNYDFSDIIQEMLPDELDKDVVQQMIDESLDNLTISR
jgi:metal-dependent amidase/aminoacylase/carboxypeptidase family protein